LVVDVRDRIQTMLEAPVEPARERIDKGK
jgi:hypothetical protein